MVRSPIVNVRWRNCSVLTKLDHLHREDLAQDKKQDNDDQDSTEADIHMNLHRAADPLRGYLSMRQ